MSDFFQQLTHTGIYKRSQGRITRQVTFAALAIGLALGMWRLSQILETATWWGILSAVRLWLPGPEYWLPGGLLLAGWWIAYRAVNVPAFADFLIAVEAEMNKVSWPTRTELFRASMVVLIMIFALAAVLAGFDLFWKAIFTYVIKIF